MFEKACTEKKTEDIRLKFVKYGPQMDVGNKNNETFINS